MCATPKAVDPATEELRRKLYNATVVSVRHLHEDLMIMRVRPDGGIPPFAAGQYATLGLGDWEPRVSYSGEEDAEVALAGKLIRRAYSVSASILNDARDLRRAPDCDYLEFYITLVRRSGGKGPSLTPRLFNLKSGDRIWCMKRMHGTYVLDNLAPEKNVVFAATGTGEAPHNAMLAELLSRRHPGRISSVVCVRYERDLGYLTVHRELERRYSNYRYLKLTTREPVNLDPNEPGYVGKRYLQDYFKTGELEKDLGWSIDPVNTEIFLCGNPTMIGLPKHKRVDLNNPGLTKGMFEMLEARGFLADTPTMPGTIHSETYW